MYIGCGTVCFRTLPIDEVLKIISEIGYNWVEPQATGPWCPHVDVDNDDPEAYKKKVAGFGFKGMTALWAPNGAIIPDKDCVTGISKAIEWAAKAGIPVVNAGDGAKSEDMSEDDALNILKERLDAILKTAEKCGVYLAIEPHGTFSVTPDGLKKIMSLSSSKWLGVNYDTANIHRASYVETMAGAYTWKKFGEPGDEVSTLSSIVDRVVHVHVKDLKNNEGAALGEGEVNIKDCIEVLDKAGYKGVLSLETEGGVLPEEAKRIARVSRDYLIKTLGELNINIES